jgi:hypothetical protein
LSSGVCAGAALAVCASIIYKPGTGPIRESSR